MPAQTEPDAPERARVLLVDDDERNLLAISTVIEDLADVVTASSGEEALRHLLRGDFAVILLDVYMPGMDGYETASLIRARPGAGRIPIVFLSAVNKESEHLLRGYDLGAVDYVFKPVEPLVLRSKVAVFTDLHLARREVLRKAREERRLVEAALRAEAEKLEAERQLRAAEQQLLQAQKMDAVGQLTGGIAHDFNNLLAAVLGGLGMIERRVPLDEKQAEILRMTRHAADKGTELVRRLLAFARRQALEPARVEVAELAGNVSQLLSHTLGGRVELRWDVADDIWPAFVDASQLELALVNLAINARDAMPDGGCVTLTARNRVCESGECEAPAGEYLELCVADEGEGIAPEHIERVLEPFFTTKPVGKGTGLGLPMVYGFARQSGGAVRIQSELGEGTRVTLLLPRAPEGTGAAGAAAPGAADEEDAPSLHVALVDDDAAVRVTTAALLEDLGHGVTPWEEPAPALDALRAGPDAYDLLVTDFAMPACSGVELIRGARARSPGLPAIIITGYADLAPLADRPDDVVVLAKPFTADALKAAIRKVTRARVRTEERRAAA